MKPSCQSQKRAQWVYPSSCSEFPFPAPTHIVPSIEAPNEFLQKARSDYWSSHRFTFALNKLSQPNQKILNVSRSIEIARAFETLPLFASDRETAEVYAVCAKEIEAQFVFLKNEVGITFDFVAGENDGYPGAAAMMQDLRDNLHLSVFTGGEDHSVFGKISADKSGLTINDKFRAIHDALGHAPNGNRFDASGEENAFCHHTLIFSNLAVRALASELRGQNSWMNFGPHLFDEHGFVGNPNHPKFARIFKTRPFARQKVALLPLDFERR